MSVIRTLSVLLIFIDMAGIYNVHGSHISHIVANAQRRSYGGQFDSGDRMRLQTAEGSGVEMRVQGRANANIHRDAAGRFIHSDCMLGGKIRLGDYGGRHGGFVEGEIACGASFGALGLGADLMLAIRAGAWVKVKLSDIAYIVPQLLWINAASPQDKAKVGSHLPPETGNLAKELAKLIERNTGLKLERLGDIEILLQIRYTVVGVGVSIRTRFGEVVEGFEMYGAHMTLAVGVSFNGGAYFGIAVDNSAVLIEMQAMGVALRAVITDPNLKKKIINLVKPECEIIIENKSKCGLKLELYDDEFGYFKEDRGLPREILSGHRATRVFVKKDPRVPAWEGKLLFTIHPRNPSPAVGAVAFGWNLLVGGFEKIQADDEMKLAVQIVDNELDSGDFRGRMEDRRQRYRQHQHSQLRLKASAQGSWRKGEARIVFTIDNR